MSALCSRTRVRIKQKPGPLCEETVDAGDSLWKLVENPASTLRPLAEVALAKVGKLLRGAGLSVFSYAAVG